MKGSRMAAFRKAVLRVLCPLLGRSATAAAADRPEPTLLHLGLLGHLERLVDLNAEVPDSAF